MARNKDFAGIAFFTKLDVAGIDSGMQILNTTGLKMFCFVIFPFKHSRWKILTSHLRYNTWPLHIDLIDGMSSFQILAPASRLPPPPPAVYSCRGITTRPHKLFQLKDVSCIEIVSTLTYIYIKRRSLDAGYTHFKHSYFRMAISVFSFLGLLMLSRPE